MVSGHAGSGNFLGITWRGVQERGVGWPAGRALNCGEKVPGREREGEDNRYFRLD
jgi:hypothetical protein